MTPQRQEQLLELVDAITAELCDVSVPLLAGGAAGQGVPPACVGTVTSYLARVRDRGRLEAFVAHIDQLDPITAQNRRHPRACYGALRLALQRRFEQHVGLTAEEWLYVLSWVRRLLPKEDVADGGEREREETRPHTPAGGRARPAQPTRPRQAGTALGALADALRKAGMSPSSKPRR